MKDYLIERRFADRKIVNKYYTVEMVIHDITFAYRFKVWDISPEGISLLVNEDSDLLKYLKVGNTLNLKYHTADLSKPAACLNTQVRHISKDDAKRFKGFCVVGLSIPGKQDYETRDAVKVTCPSCRTGYKLPIGRVPQKRTVVRCRKCGGRIVIEPTLGTS